MQAQGDRWGHVGSGAESWEQHPDGLDVSGLTRSVSADVQYAAPPWGPTWSPVRGNAHRFFLPLDGRPGDYSTLLQVAEEIRSDPSPPNLERLDAIVDAVMALARRLHESRCGLGMVTPENVILRRKDVILTDVGFYFRGGSFRPRWLDEPPYPQLWDASPGAQQMRGLVCQGEFDPCPDIKTLARIWQGVLSGRWQKNPIPAREIRQSTCDTQLWEVLEAAMVENETFPNLDEFAAQLKERTPLSHHFNNPNPPPPPVGPGVRTALIAMAFATMILGTGVAAAMYLGFVPIPGFLNPEHRNPPSSDGQEHSESRASIQDVPQPLDPSSPLESALSKCRDSEKDPFKQLDALVAADSVELATGDPQLTSELGRISYRRGQFCEGWIAKFSDARLAFDEPSKKSDAFKVLKLLRDSLVRFGQLKRNQVSDETKRKEQQCIEVISLLGSDPQMPEGFSRSLQPSSSPPQP
jgi:hypothetical protein